jgi:hypothetical protein
VTPIQKHMLMIFITLRWGVGIVGVSLPLILTGVGYCVYRISLAGSMSAYYHATRNCSGIKAVQQQELAESSTTEPASGPLPDDRNWAHAELVRR